jgi:hypothetical protein
MFNLIYYNSSMVSRYYSNTFSLLNVCTIWNVNRPQIDANYGYTCIVSNFISGGANARIKNRNRLLPIDLAYSHKIRNILHDTDENEVLFLYFQQENHTLKYSSWWRYCKISCSQKNQILELSWAWHPSCLKASF